MNRGASPPAVKSLYVTDRAAIGDERFGSLLGVLRDAPDLSVQLREKNVSDREYFAWAGTCRERLGPKVCLYVNRRLDIALAARTDGVHLPADGLPLSRVRTHTPRGFKIGVSTHSRDEAVRAIEGRADLVLLGPIFQTPSKMEYGPPLGVEALAGLPPRSGHSAEVLAIGGINEERLEQLEPYRGRISGVAGIRLFQESEDPRALAQRISRR